MQEALAPAEKVSTGVAGLDSVLEGGLPARQMHLILGSPGAGKTTLALHFLLDGVAKGERALYVTLAESITELRQIARSHGWSLDGIEIREFMPSEEAFRREQQYTILHAGEVEFSDTIELILKEVDELQPSRVVFDSLAELRLLARDNVRYRHQILGLKQAFATRDCTFVLLDNAEGREQSLESIAHSVVILEQSTPEYGRTRRRLQVTKVRGSNYRSGYHDMEIVTGGVIVYPRLVAADTRDTQEQNATSPEHHLFPSDVEELDNLLGGGLPGGTSALFIGPAGAGKSTLAAQYAAAAASRGQRSAIYLFEELRRTYMDRAEGLGIPIRGAVVDGLITIHQLDPTEISPGAFIQRIRTAVEQDGVDLLVIDSLNGYLTAMQQEPLVIAQMHELLTYLGQHGVLTILTMSQHGLVGESMKTPLDVSYMADTVLLLRYFEAAGEVRQAISAVKKRSGGHERSIRELRFGPGVHVGETLHDFEGVMAGTPRFVGHGTVLFGND